MGDKTGIEWTDATWNPVRGCSLVSDGCKNCYAMHVAARFNGEGLPYEGLTFKTSQGPKWTGKIMQVESVLDQPSRWSRPRRIFVNSMSDLFHDGVPDEFIDRVFGEMAGNKRHTFQVLTKRPERMRDYMNDPMRHERIVENQTGAWGKRMGLQSAWPSPNVWLGVSVENQETANQRIPILMETNAAVRWLSMEPLLGPVELFPIYKKTVTFEWIDWVVVGGESGAGARPMRDEWVRDIRDTCDLLETPFLFKQWGDWLPFSQRQAGQFVDSVSYPQQNECWRVGKRIAGRLLDDVLHDGYPNAVPA